MNEHCFSADETSRSWVFTAGARMTESGWSANYYPFGEVASQTGSNVDTRFDFTGQERDEGTGLMYFGARYYDPVIGRFLGVDPLVEDFHALSSYKLYAQ